MKKRYGIEKKRLWKLLPWLSGENRIIVSRLVIVKCSDPAGFVTGDPEMCCQTMYTAIPSCFSTSSGASTHRAKRA